MRGHGKVRMLAPAKLNLALHVTGRRDDGYHLLDTLAVFTEFGDLLTLEIADRDQLTVTGPYSTATPCGPENIVIRALSLYREMTDVHVPPVSITLEKNLPVASGIGGGSSDAAALLKSVDRLSGYAAGDDGLAAIGGRLGADLPMCLHAAPLKATGIGEKIELLDRFPTLAVVLANPGVEIPTPTVFAELETKDNPPLPQIFTDIAVGQFADWLRSTRNDLEPPAMNLFPNIAEARRLLETSGAEFVRMSGSGATFFGIFSDMENAANAAADIKDQKPDWFVVATGTGAK
jgi:4-diphosphocytidyl-2-C-methyl-D-erythritol kinase